MALLRKALTVGNQTVTGPLVPQRDITINGLPPERNTGIGDYTQIWRSQLWVRVAVAKISTGIARLPLKIYGRDATGDRTRVTESPLAVVLSRPNERKDTGTQFGFLCRVLRDLLIFGNALILTDKNAPDDMPTKLVPVTDTGWEYDDKADAYIRPGQPTRPGIPAWQMVHLLEMSAPGGFFGISRLEALQRTLEIEDAAQRLGLASFKNGGRLSGLISVKGNLTEEGANRFKEQVRRLYGGVDNAYGIPVLEGDADWRTMSNSMDEAAVVPFRRLSREEVAAAFDIPQPAIGILDEANFASIQELHKTLYVDTFGPWLQLIEQGLQAQLVDPVPALAGQYVEFELGEILRADITTRAEAYQRFISSGVLTQNECRELENRPRSTDEGADRLLTPVNLAPDASIGVA